MAISDNSANGVVILGGTFDPIHYGHLRLAEELRQALPVREVRLLPCFQPVHRGQPGATTQQRLDMLKLAVEDSELNIDEKEIVRSGPSYMVDTLDALRHELGASTPIILAMGTDAFQSLPCWHEWERLLSQCHITVAQRPDYHTGSLPPALESKLNTSKVEQAKQLADLPFGRIYFYPMTPLAISATQIRTLVSQQKSLRFLLPNKVESYIKQHQIYHQEKY
tara:strand:+ start:51 stop:719 length:669 start_codon:yes stop_codon:yes gene_type:complete